MRLDKFLKVSRLIKQRVRAKELCEQGSIKINSRVAKAGSDVKIGDVIQMIIGDRIITARVLIVPDGNVSRVLSKDLTSIEGVVDFDEITSKCD